MFSKNKSSNLRVGCPAYACLSSLGKRLSSCCIVLTSGSKYINAPQAKSGCFFHPHAFTLPLSGPQCVLCLCRGLCLCASQFYNILSHGGKQAYGTRIGFSMLDWRTIKHLSSRDATCYRRWRTYYILRYLPPILRIYDLLRPPPPLNPSNPRSDLWSLKVKTCLSSIKGCDGQPLSVKALTVAPGGVETSVLQNTIVPEDEISAF